MRRSLPSTRRLEDVLVDIDAEVSADVSVLVYEFLINTLFPFSVPLVFAHYGYAGCVNRGFIPPPFGGGSVAVTQYFFALLLWLCLVLAIWVWTAPGALGVTEEESVFKTTSVPTIAILLMLHLLRCATIAVKYSFFSETAYAALSAAIQPTVSVNKTLLLYGWANPVKDLDSLYSEMERSARRCNAAATALSLRLPTAAVRTEALWAMRAAVPTFLERDGHRLSDRARAALALVADAVLAEGDGSLQSGGSASDVPAHQEKPGAVESPLRVASGGGDACGGSVELADETGARPPAPLLLEGTGSQVHTTAARPGPARGPAGQGCSSCTRANKPSAGSAVAEAAWKGPATAAVAAAVGKAAAQLGALDLPAKLLAWHWTRLAMHYSSPPWADRLVLLAAGLFSVAPVVVRAALGMAPVGTSAAEVVFMVACVIFSSFHLALDLSYLVVGAVDMMRRRRLESAVASACDPMSRRVMELPDPSAEPFPEGGDVGGDQGEQASQAAGGVAGAALSARPASHRTRQSVAERTESLPSSVLARRLRKEAGRLRLPLSSPENAHSLSIAHAVVRGVGEAFHLRVQAFTIFFGIFVAGLLLFLVVEAMSQAGTIGPRTTAGGFAQAPLVAIASQVSSAIQSAIALVAVTLVLFSQVLVGAAGNSRATVAVSNLRALAVSADAGAALCRDPEEEARLQAAGRALGLVACAESAGQVVRPIRVAGVMASYALSNSLASVLVSGVVAAAGALNLL